MVLADLRRIRRAGLIGVRELPLPALDQLFTVTGSEADQRVRPAAIERLVREAVADIGGGRLAEAAEYTFGLAPGARDWPAQDRRRRAAAAYRVSLDRFRKHYEKIVLAQTAETILRRAARVPSTDPWGVDGSRTVRGPAGAPVTVHATSIDLVTGVAVAVCPTNTYLELPNTYKDSVAACLRRAGARKDGTGRIVADSVSAALRRWCADQGQPGRIETGGSRAGGSRAGGSMAGLAVAPGTLVPVPVDPGSDLDFRRIYFAAVAVPRVGTSDYDVDPASVSRATRAAFRTARQERYASICLPLLGSGRGGLDHRVSLRQIWSVVEEELRADPSWRVHLVARRPDLAALVWRALAERYP